MHRVVVDLPTRECSFKKFCIFPCVLPKHMGSQEGLLFTYLGDKCRTKLHYTRKFQFITGSAQLKIPNIIGKSFPTLNLKLCDRHRKVLSVFQLTPPHHMPQF